MSLTVRVITPDQTAWDDSAEEVILPSTTGQLGILGGHAPLLSALDVGVLQIRPGRDWQAIALGSGFAEVENDEITILVNSAERGEEVDAEAARSAFQQAQERVEQSESGEDSQEKIQASQDLKRARARLLAATGKVE
ncbi:MAG: F0F1 ATP synthase subunit epsilon [Cyanobacteria bacterium QS_3_48_167]|nr:MAG: F0F1 ATP synthase subunit epsilon [Cyanobacteria bacterium QS_3_48_167]